MTEPMTEPMTGQSLPKPGPNWRRRGRAVGFAANTAVAWLFNAIMLPPFPASPAAFTMPYLTEVLTWGTSVSFLVSGFIGLVHLLFHYFWKNLFKAAGKADVPLLKELAPGAIKEAKAANS